MGSSPGFGSTTSNCFALFGLGFPAASELLPLHLAARRHSPARSSIRTPSGRPAPYGTGPGPPTGCRPTVSGSVSLPARGAFHRSLTVLVRYRSPGVFSLGRWASPLPTGFPGSRGTPARRYPARPAFAYRTLTVYGGPFQTPSAPRTAWSRAATATRPDGRRPRPDNAGGLCHPTGLGCSPFARRYWGNRGCFLLLGVLRCFTSPGAPPTPMDSAPDPAA